MTFTQWRRLNEKVGCRLDYEVKNGVVTGAVLYDSGGNFVARWPE